jgi:hypothetical protein
MGYSAHLEDPLIFFSMGMVRLLGSRDVVFQICNGVFPGLQTLSK